MDGVVWEVVSTFDTPKIWKVRLKMGSNSVELRDDGAYKVLTPRESTSFELYAETRYRVEFWGPKERLTREIEFSFPR